MDKKLESKMMIGDIEIILKLSDDDGYVTNSIELNTKMNVQHSDVLYNANRIIEMDQSLGYDNKFPLSIDYTDKEGKEKTFMVLDKRSVILIIDRLECKSADIFRGILSDECFSLDEFMKD